MVNYRSYSIGGKYGADQPTGGRLHRLENNFGCCVVKATAVCVSFIDPWTVGLRYVLGMRTTISEPRKVELESYINV